MWQTLVVHCSEDRLDKYLDRVAKDEISAEFLYVANHRVSESLYPLLSILEVSLRNRVHTQLTAKFSRRDWWTHEILNIHTFATNHKEKIEKAKSKIYHRSPHIDSKQKIKASQIVAELSLNFWTDLFHKDLEKVLWADLMACFTNIPSDSKKRRKVARPLENLTRLRNRVMHHEPILFDASALPDVLHKRGTELLSWMSNDMADWLAKSDRFQTVWGKYMATKSYLDAWLGHHAALNAARGDHQTPSLRPLYAARDLAKAQFHEKARAYIG